MWSFIQAAGWPVWPLLFTSVAALALIIERLWATQPERVYSEIQLKEVLGYAHRNRSATEIAILAESSQLGLILAAGLTCRPRDRAHLREAFEAAGHKAAANLEKNLSLLSMIATVAPLMGLLGTVVGMIEVFGSQSSLGSDPQALAHGISVALYNTAFGLVIAIPAAIAHRFFRIRADDYLLQLEEAARALLDVLVHPARTAAATAPAGTTATTAPRPAVTTGAAATAAPARPRSGAPSAGTGTPPSGPGPVGGTGNTGYPR